MWHEMSIWTLYLFIYYHGCQYCRYQSSVDSGRRSWGSGLGPHNRRDPRRRHGLQGQERPARGRHRGWHGVHYSWSVLNLWWSVYFIAPPSILFYKKHISFIQTLNLRQHKLYKLMLWKLFFKSKKLSTGKTEN